MLLNNLTRFGLLTIFVTISSTSLFADEHDTHLSGKKLLNSIRTVVNKPAISDENALVTGFRLGFNRAAIPAPISTDYTLSVLGKCGTELVKTYYQSKQSLSTESISEIESYLHPKSSQIASIYNSPSGLFRVTYVTSGSNAVPTADGNTNGIPDYVERVALYFDQSWDKEVTELGFTAPPASSSNPYLISFENMEYYGYTEPISGTNGTHIVMHNTYSGFPANNDPEGKVIGAAKVTAAHEFKHALQFMSAGWNGESANWLEMDATWAEDIVYDYVNDYYNYLTGSGNLFTTPATTLNPGSYEDATFSHYFSQSISEVFWVEVWKAIEENTNLTMVEALTSVLSEYGKSFQHEFNSAYVWHAASGSRAVAGFGFDEAAKFPTQTPTKTHTSSPLSGTQSGSSLAKLSANIISIKPAAIPSSDTLYFDGADNGNLGVSIVTLKKDGTLTTEYFAPDPISKKDTLLFNTPDSLVKEIVLVVTNNNNSASTTFRYGPGVLANYLLYGDLNETKTITAVDASAILKNAAGTIPPYIGDKFIAGDVSGNKILSAYDASLILQKSAGLIQFFPVDANKDGFGPEIGSSKINSQTLTGIRVNQANDFYLINSQSDIAISAIDVVVSGSTTDLNKVTLIPLFSESIVSDRSMRQVNSTQSELVYASASGEEVTGKDLLKIQVNGKLTGNLTIRLSVNESEEAELLLKPTADFTEVPDRFSVEQNYPNPFNPSTSIKFGLADKQQVTIKVFNLLGQDVTVLLKGLESVKREFPAGYHSIQIEAGSLPSGTYLYQVKAGNSVQTRKMTLLK